MVYHKYYHQCMQGMGRQVEIRTKSGSVHRGIIHRVTPNKVYIRPMGRGHNYGGHGYGYGGYGWGGEAVGFAFGAIATLAFLSFFW